MSPGVCAALWGVRGRRRHHKVTQQRNQRREHLPKLLQPSCKLSEILSVALQSTFPAAVLAGAASEASGTRNVRWDSPKLCFVLGKTRCWQQQRGPGEGVQRLRVPSTAEERRQLLFLLAKAKCRRQWRVLPAFPSGSIRSQTPWGCCPAPSPAVAPRRCLLEERPSGCKHVGDRLFFSWSKLPMDSRLSFLLEERIPWLGCSAHRDAAQLGGKLLSSPLFFIFSPFYPAGPKAGSLQSYTCHCCHGVRVGDGGQGTRCQLLSCFTLQQLTMCFFSPEPDPTSCKQHAKNPLNLLAKKMGFPSQAGEGREINPAAKNSEIRKRF